MTIPLHCHYIVWDLLLLCDFMTHYFETLASNRIHRKPPNLDKEIVQGVMKVFNCIPLNRDEEWIL